VLKGIDSLLNGDLLKILDDMGHTDQLLVVDRNYPAFSAGKQVVRLGECGVDRAVEAILSVFPLDAFVEHPLQRMEVEDDPNLTTPVQHRVLEIARAAHGRPCSTASSHASTSTAGPTTHSRSSTHWSRRPTDASSCRRASCSPRARNRTPRRG
jgi:L-fucose mutarotase